MSFPTSMEREPLVAWLARETDIQPDSVVAVTSQALTAIVSTFPPGSGEGARVVLRAEALNPETYARTGALSWHVSLSADCQGHRVRLGDTTGYPERNLLGERKLLRPAEADWRKPEPGTALDNAWRAACDKNFRGPFQEPGLRLTQPELAIPDPQSLARQGPAPQAPVAKAAAPLQTSSPGAAVTPVATPAAGVRAVQIGAASSEDDARSMLRELGERLGGREAWIEKAVVAGRTWYRAVVGGFEDGASAAKFCAQLQTQGHACFVRSARRS